MYCKQIHSLHVDLVSTVLLARSYSKSGARCIITILHYQSTIRIGALLQGRRPFQEQSVPRGISSVAQASLLATKHFVTISPHQPPCAAPRPSSSQRRREFLRRLWLHAMAEHYLHVVRPCTVLPTPCDQPHQRQCSTQRQRDKSQYPRIVRRR